MLDSRYYNWELKKGHESDTVSLNIFYSGIKYSEKDWCSLNCDITLSNLVADVFINMVYLLSRFYFSVHVYTPVTIVINERFDWKYLDTSNMDSVQLKATVKAKVCFDVMIVKKLLSSRYARIYGN